MLRINATTCWCHMPYKGQPRLAFPAGRPEYDVIRYTKRIILQHSAGVRAYAKPPER